MGLVKVQIIMNEIKMDKLIEALKKHKITGMTVYKAMGCGVQYGTPEYKEEDTTDIRLLEKTVVDLVMPEDNLTHFIEYIEKNLYTGHIGDGKIFVSDIKTAYRIRTGEEGYDAVQPAKF
ncbi:MAG: P-II family nitrogen regulator [Saccharofermentans sp.]|nr:P-II family nitrogen regulator [Saccharofermentans sp.]